MKKLVTQIGGEIYAIPLFTSDEPNKKRFTKDVFKDREKEFAFCRVIIDKGGGGFFMEIFNIIGDLNQDLKSIITSKRLFRPIAVSGVGIYKKRWRELYIQASYDKEKDSKYSEVQLVLGTNDDLRLFQNGNETPISEEEAKKYEFWKIWMPSQLEKRIIENIYNQ